MKEVKAHINVLELKRLIVQLKEQRPDICIRVRLAGEMWHREFMRVLHTTEKGVILNNEKTQDVVMISNLKHVIQFEIDRKFQNFEPHFHYDVKLSPEF